MVDLHAVADEFNRIAVFHPIVMDVERPPAFGHRPAGVLGNRNGSVANIMIDLVIFVPFEGELDGEAHFDGVVVNMALRY